MTRLGHLSTEGARAERAEIDRLPTAELVRLMNADDAVVPRGRGGGAGRRSRRRSTRSPTRLAAGGRLIYVGAGTAGRIGVLDASECGPTFNTDRVRRRDRGRAGRGEQRERERRGRPRRRARWRLAALGVGARDAVVGISASGRTPYVLGAVERAARGRRADGRARLQRGHRAERGGRARRSRWSSGPEFIAGSTRLKAGTAQKLVLNMLSTLTMVRLGKTYGNLMVDVRVTNEKLRDRATRIVEQVAGATARTAAAALGGGRRRRQGRDRRCCAPASTPDGARERLDAADGHLRAALGE